MGMPERIYLDTEALLAEGWPRISVNLKSLLEAASFLKIPVFLPKVVELELEDHWLQNFRQRKEDIKKLNKHLLSTKVEIPISEDEAVEEYRQAVSDMMKTHNIKSTPITEVRVEDLLKMSIVQHPPFKGGGKGFHDAIILHSIVDDLKGSNKPAAFVSKDKDFEAPEIQDFLAERNVRLEILNSARDLLVSLVNSLKEAVKNLYNKEQGYLKAELEKLHGRINEYILVNLEISEGELSKFGFGWFGRVSRISGVELGQLKNVVPPNPLEKKIGNREEISFEVEATLHVKGESSEVPTGTSTDRTYKVGEEIPPTDILTPSLMMAFQGPRVETREVSRTIRMEGSALVLEEGYRDIEFTGVRLA